MKLTTRLLIFILPTLMLSCVEDKKLNLNNLDVWKDHKAVNLPTDSLVSGTTYLSAYSQIYSRSEDMMHNLTVTVSMRNMNTADSIYIISAQYYHTDGKLVKAYFEEPIFLKPMETVEIVISEIDEAGGTGGNFLFDWKTNPNVNAPHFEAVMISTMGQQGLSFLTHGINVD
ncbi:MAG: DUF3124 domain-containing protein [Cyclobacteriaceae bacterium]